MTASSDRNLEEENTTQKFPSAFEILFYSIVLTKRYANEVYGFAAYLLFPIILAIGTQNVSGTFGEILSATVNVLFILLACWIHAAIITLVSMRATHPKKDPDPRSVGLYALSILNTLVFALLLSTLIQFAGYVLFIIPGIILTVLLSFASQEVVLHGAGPLSALAASRAKIQPFFLPIAWRFIVLTIGILGSYIILTAIIFALVSLATGIDFVTLVTVTPTWLDALLTVLQIAFLPPLIIGQTVLYLATETAPKEPEK
ncbi:MAG: hypothetical protein WCT28_01075 [Patescibacteria group bacterium]|jgi:hypothetical protein